MDVVSALAFAATALVAVAYAWWKLSGWMVDDAAISLAYARNLGLNGSLTAQLGEPPVEGFSNPLWVGILALAQRLRFGIEAARYLGGTFLSLAILRLAFSKCRYADLQLAFRLVALFLALQPAVVIWSLSGLENSLSVLAGTELLLRACMVATGDRDYKRHAIYAGIAASAIAVTRPEGIAYVVVFPLAFFAVHRSSSLRWNVVAWAVVLPLSTWAGYELFRWFYFGDLAPNTYYAKGGVTVNRIIEVAFFGDYAMSQLRALAESLFGWAGALWCSLSVAVAIVLWNRHDRAASMLIAPFAMMAVASFLYLTLPSDWMGDHRYATLFYPPAYLVITVVIVSSPPLARTRHLLLAALLVWSAWNSFAVLHRFSQAPVISNVEVEERGSTFERWSSKLGLERASLMTADVGGLLWRNKLVVVDLGMLTDRTIAMSLGEGSPQADQKAFHKYVFETRKPDFIATRAFHSWIANLDADPRFRQDYVPIREYVDEWILRRYGKQRMSGDYVRRDKITGDPGLLAGIQDDAAKRVYPFCGDCVTSKR